ncbi:MAG TPA: diaminopimelate epimerase [Kofleriaceae bacterium]
MRFAKYHGLGNDFVVVDLRDADAATALAIQDPDVVRAVCDRQFGVGGDGVLAILPATTATSVARMRVLNADGSEAEMCGNGIRCVVEVLHGRGVTANPMAIDTGAGQLVCERIEGGVTVAMGAPRLTRGEIPMAGPPGERCISQPLDNSALPFGSAASPAQARLVDARGQVFSVTGVSMGNPHAVIFVADDGGQDLRALAETFGPAIETCSTFPARTNVEFVRTRSRTELDVVVWERGCGITLACGTGACATVVAAILNNRCDEETDVCVNLLGGSLTIRVLANMANVSMTGPAVHVFDGELEPRAVRPRPRR